MFSPWISHLIRVCCKNPRPSAWPPGPCLASKLHTSGVTHHTPGTGSSGSSKCAIPVRLPLCPGSPSALFTYPVKVTALPSCVPPPHTAARGLTPSVVHFSAPSAGGVKGLLGPIRTCGSSPCKRLQPPVSLTPFTVCVSLIGLPQGLRITSQVAFFRYHLLREALPDHSHSSIPLTPSPPSPGSFFPAHPYMCLSSLL